MKSYTLKLDDALAETIRQRARNNNISMRKYILHCVFKDWMITGGRLPNVVAQSDAKENKRDEKERSKGKEERNKETSLSPRAQGEKSFVSPTLDEVKEYANKRGVAEVDAEAFYDFYTACDWIIGANKPMKNWKSAMRMWLRRKPCFEPRKTRAELKEAAAEANAKRAADRERAERIEAAKDPSAWQLCAERCRRFRDGKCTKGRKWPPNLDPRPIPPEECTMFEKLRS